MIVYSATKTAFHSDVMTNDIENIILDAFKGATGHATGQSEIDSWKHSLRNMDSVLSDSAIPDNAGVAIEYHIPQSSKRVDFILTGKDQNQQDTAILIELKQWQSALLTDKDGVVVTHFKGGQAETAHPSYQAWSYKTLLEDYNQAVYGGDIQLLPCAYLHNYVPDGTITNSFYNEYLDRAPVFLKPDAFKLQTFIKQYIKYGDDTDIMYRIDHGKIKPSKNLADQLSSMLAGNQDFVLIDDQKVVFETVKQLAMRSSSAHKNVLIVEGGPGTGKSVVAINLLVELTKGDLIAQYVTRNSAPRKVYEAKLTGTLNKSRISNMFRSANGFHASLANTFDTLIVDEAHRLNEKSGLYGNEGENQVKEIVNASTCSIFFVDEDQKVTLKDIGDKEEIRKWASELGATVTEMKLESQFRCNGSDGYLAWLDNTLQIRDTANKTLEDIDYDFRVFDDPQALHDAIIEKNQEKNKARMVAGYCWKWISAKNPLLKDIVIGDYAATWNLKSDGQAWIIQPESVSEVGCVHTSQGLEVDYVGVIIGSDMIVRNGQVITDVMQRASSDRSVMGRIQMLKNDPVAAAERFDTIIKNTYRTLMTRGQKGCYVYCTDEETAEYLRRIRFS